MEIAQEVSIMGAPADEYVTMLSDGATSYLALANLKLTTRQVAAAVRQGNCGSANELMATAWQQFIGYAPLASRVGQTGAVASQAKNLALWDAKIGRMCASGNAGPGGMLGDFGMFEKLDIRQSFAEHKKAWLVGGGIAAALVAFVMFKK